MSIYVLIPVRVRISSVGSEEITRAQELVESIVKDWQETCVSDWNDNGPEKGSNATSPETQPSYVFVRESYDPIDVAFT